MLTKAEIKRLRSLHDKSGRETLGLFAVEGPKVVAELLAAGFPFAELYATEAWSGPAPAGLRRITPAEMARISHFPTPSEILAVALIVRPPLPAGALDRGLTLALDGIQDPGNVGTLVRIADWYAIDRVVLSPDCADPFSPKVIGASMGSFARVPVHTADLPAVLAGVRVPVLGCGLEGGDIHGVGPVKDAVIVIGSEGRGLSEPVRQRVTRHVTIPRFGGAESLNAAVAGAIACDCLRARR
jgi:TrmH family RNA methyltransferase